MAADAGTYKATVRIEKHNWSPEQIADALAHHGLPDDADLHPEHFAAAGHDTPHGGIEVEEYND